MSRPWMPLYVADYVADTAHLNAAESGAYLHLIMHYWLNGSLPDDDRKLARIARMTDRQWTAARATIAEFFQGKWKHKRIDAELARAAEISGKRRASAEQRHSKRDANAPANAEQMQTHTRASPPSQSHSEPSGSAAPAAVADDVEPVGEDPKAKLYRVGKTILVSFGVAEKRTGSLIGQWLKTVDAEGLLAAIQYAREQNVAEPVAYITTLVNGSKNGKSQQGLGDLARELAATARDREREAGLFGPDAAQ